MVIQNPFQFFPGSRPQLHARARLIQKVNGLVRQVAVLTDPATCRDAKKWRSFSTLGRETKGRKVISFQPCLNLSPGSRFVIYSCLHIIPVPKPWSIPKKYGFPKNDFSPRFLLTRVSIGASLAGMIVSGITSSRSHLSETLVNPIPSVPVLVPWIPWPVLDVLRSKLHAGLQRFLRVSNSVVGLAKTEKAFSHGPSGSHLLGKIWQVLTSKLPCKMYMSMSDSLAEKSVL